MDAQIESLQNRSGRNSWQAASSMAGGTLFMVLTAQAIREAVFPAHEVDWAEFDGMSFHEATVISATVDG